MREPLASRPSRFSVKLTFAPQNKASMNWVFQRIRIGVSGQGRVWSLGLIVGVLAGYATIAFRYAIEGISLFAFGVGEESLASGAANLHAGRVWAAPILGGLLVSVILFAAQRRGWLKNLRAEGVADVIEARAVKSGRIDPKAGALSALIATASLGFGASAGREGPAIHLGASISGWIASTLNLPRREARTLLGCGAAAAVAASFNAPIAGVLFAFEVILGHYALSVFGPITLASVTAAAISRLQFGAEPAFTVPPFDPPTISDLPLAFVLGLVCGVTSAAFLHLCRIAETSACRVTKRYSIPIPLLPVFGGFIVGGLGVLLPEVLGVGYETTTMALRLDYGVLLLTGILLVKMIATATSLACRFGGGVFSPSVCLGAISGAAFGLVVNAVFPDQLASPTFYAVLGMGAFAGAVLGAPISTTLIAFELTGNYDMTIALLIAVSAAVIASRTLFGRSFFHWQLVGRGIDLNEGPQGVILQTIRVRDVMAPLPSDAPPLEAEAKRLRARQSLGEALAAMEAAAEEGLPVVSDKDTAKIIGYLSSRAALNAYNRALVDAHVEEHR